MTQVLSQWIPGPDVVDHDGEPIPAEAIFFTAPPREIGEVFTAHAGIVAGKKASQSGAAIRAAVLYALLGAVLGLGLGAIVSAENGIVLSIGVVFGASVGAALSLAMARGRDNVTYTGANGIARFAYSEDPARRDQPNMFLFANAVELRTGQTRQYTNGIYSGTHYFFKWTGPDGKLVYQLNGTYNSEKGTPKPGHAFYYARAAEIAWSRYLLAFVNAELERSGAFRFNLNGNNCVVAGPGYLDLYMNGQQIRCAVDEIAGMSIHQGQITITRKDSKSGFLGIGSQGIFRFQYAQLANARVFQLLIEQLVRL